MFKRCFAFLLLTASFLLLCPVTARADSIFIPDYMSYNPFYIQHANECEYVGRIFYANGPDGHVSITLEPDLDAEYITIGNLRIRNTASAILNGIKIDIQCTYAHNGRLWGFWEADTPNGWIPMDHLVLVYDAISFEEEHQDELYDAPTAGYEKLKETERVFFWSWPGSGETVGKFSQESEAVELLYTDDQGREWGKIGDLNGYKNIWVCLSDPANNEIPAFNAAPKPELRGINSVSESKDSGPESPSDGQIPAPGASPTPEQRPAAAVHPPPAPVYIPNDNDSPGIFSIPWLIIISVTGVVAVTAVLIWVFWKPNKP